MTLSGWEILLIRAVVLPVLKNIADILSKQAKETPDTWDDIVIGMFQSVIAFLENPGFAIKITERKNDETN